MSRGTATGDLLLQAGLVDSAGLTQALELQQKGDHTLGRTLATLGLADEQTVSAAIAKKLRLEHLIVGTVPEGIAELTAILTNEFCRKRMVAALSHRHEYIQIVA